MLQVTSFFSHHKLKGTNIFVEMKKRLCLHFTAFLCSRNSLGLLLAWKKNLAQQKMVREGSPEDLFFPQNFLLNSLLKAATTQIHLHFFVYCHLDKPFFWIWGSLFLWPWSYIQFKQISFLFIGLKTSPSTMSQSETE